MLKSREIQGEEREVQRTEFNKIKIQEYIRIYRSIVAKLVVIASV